MPSPYSLRLFHANEDARQAVFASRRTVCCPRTKGRITEKACAECRAAARLVPALEEVCGSCTLRAEASLQPIAGQVWKAGKWETLDIKEAS